MKRVRGLSRFPSKTNTQGKFSSSKHFPSYSRHFEERNLPHHLQTLVDPSRSVTDMENFRFEGMKEKKVIKQAVSFLRKRLCRYSSDFLLPYNAENFGKLQFLLSNTVTSICNNSVLLLGPRGSGKTMVLECVLEDLQRQHPDSISVVRLNGLLHSEDRCALKEIAKQLCIEYQLTYYKAASFDENSEFMVAMLRQCGLAHKSIIFILDEFDLFAQGKQRLLYNLLDAMQSVLSQSAVIGISSRLHDMEALQREMKASHFEQLGDNRYSIDVNHEVEEKMKLLNDADQLLEKRVRSRFSHRKLLFSPPDVKHLRRLLEHGLLLPVDSEIHHSDYVTRFNSQVKEILESKSFSDIWNQLVIVDLTIRRVIDFMFHAVCEIDPDSGLLSLGNFKNALQSLKRQPKMESLQDASVLELYLLVSMKRLESKDCESYNFNAIMKEYEDMHNSHPTCDFYSRQICLRAFEHLLERELVGFQDGRGHNIAVEFRPAKLLISSHELYEGLRTSPVCPSVLLQWFDHEKFK